MTDQPYPRPSGPSDETGPRDLDAPRVPDLPAYQPPPPAPDVASDPELRARAIKRIQERKDFKIHLTVYAVVMALLTAIWLVTGGLGEYFWPIWPMLGWGVGVALHGLSLRWDTPPTEDEIQAEARRLAQGQHQRRALPPGTPSD